MTVAAIPNKAADTKIGRVANTRNAGIPNQTKPTITTATIAKAAAHRLTWGSHRFNPKITADAMYSANWNNNILTPSDGSSQVSPKKLSISAEPTNSAATQLGEGYKSVYIFCCSHI